MAFFISTASQFYKLCAVVGALIIIVAIIFSWTRIQYLEEDVSAVFEEMVTSNLEVEGLKTELQHIDKVLQAANQAEKNKENISVDDIPYTDYEVERLRKEKSSILLYIKEKELDLITSSSIKKHVMNEVRLLFITALAVILFGTLMMMFGFLGWYFKIELFEDRRRKPR